MEGGGGLGTSSNLIDSKTNSNRDLNLEIDIIQIDR